MLLRKLHYSVGNSIIKFCIRNTLHRAFFIQPLPDGLHPRGNDVRILRWKQVKKKREKWCIRVFLYIVHTKMVHKYQLFVHVCSGVTVFFIVRLNRLGVYFTELSVSTHRKFWWPRLFVVECEPGYLFKLSINRLLFSMSSGYSRPCNILVNVEDGSRGQNRTHTWNVR